MAPSQGCRITGGRARGNSPTATVNCASAVTEVTGVGAEPSPATELSGEEAKRASLRVVRRSLPITDVARITVSWGAPFSERHSECSRYSADSPSALENEYGENGAVRMDSSSTGASACTDAELMWMTRRTPVRCAASATSTGSRALAPVRDCWWVWSGAARPAALTTVSAPAKESAR